MPVTLFDSRRKVKVSGFGAGLMASRPHFTVPYTAADAEWLAAQGEPDWDAMAAESEAQDMIEQGLCY